MKQKERKKSSRKCTLRGFSGYGTELGESCGTSRRSRWFEGWWLKKKHFFRYDVRANWNRSLNHAACTPLREEDRGRRHCVALAWACAHIRCFVVLVEAATSTATITCLNIVLQTLQSYVCTSSSCFLCTLVTGQGKGN